MNCFKLLICVLVFIFQILLKEALLNDKTAIFTLTIRNGLLSNSKLQNRKKRPNRSTNNVNGKAKRDVVREGVHEIYLIEKLSF